MNQVSVSGKIIRWTNDCMEKVWLQLPLGYSNYVAVHVQDAWKDAWMAHMAMGDEIAVEGILVMHPNGLEVRDAYVFATQIHHIRPTSRAKKFNKAANGIADQQYRASTDGPGLYTRLNDLDVEASTLRMQNRDKDREIGTLNQKLDDKDAEYQRTIISAFTGGDDDDANNSSPF